MSNSKDISTFKFAALFLSKENDAHGQSNKFHEHTCQIDSVLNSPQNGMFQIMKGSKHKHYLMLDTHYVFIKHYTKNYFGIKILYFKAMKVINICS